MARKPRDYKAEYAKRIAKGLTQGKTRQQARGHDQIDEIVKGRFKRMTDMQKGRQMSRGANVTATTIEKWRALAMSMGYYNRYRFQTLLEQYGTQTGAHLRRQKVAHDEWLAAGGPDAPNPEMLGYRLWVARMATDEDFWWYYH